MPSTVLRRGHVAGSAAFLNREYLPPQVSPAALAILASRDSTPRGESHAEFLLARCSVRFRTIPFSACVLATVSNTPLKTVIKGVNPFLVLLLGLLLLITYVPEISLWLPRLVYG
jgi:hypothetical protein